MAAVAHAEELPNLPSQSDSLHERCSLLYARLMELRSFPHYLTLIPNHDPTDPITQLWDVFSLGISLCYIFNGIAAEYGFTKIDSSAFDEEEYAEDSVRAEKHALRLFVTQIRKENVAQHIPGCETFTASEMLDRSSTDGLEKVVRTVSAIVAHLPDELFDTELDPPRPAVSAATYATTRIRIERARSRSRTIIVRELVQTERRCVESLVLMQLYATTLSESTRVDLQFEDTSDRPFPNITRMLDLHRKLLAALEDTLGMDPAPECYEQRWGLHFIDAEQEFSVCYAQYGEAYEDAADWVHENEHKLFTFNQLIARSELPAFLIRPISRCCKYPVLLEALLKVSPALAYPHHAELQLALDAARRVTDRLNAAQRRADNARTVVSLQAHIIDWKGLSPDAFGGLLLHDVMIVRRTGVDRQYHVFLFEGIMLCCKEVLRDVDADTEEQEGWPIRKTRDRAKTAPWALKGRIFVANMTRAVSDIGDTDTGSSRTYPLTVRWKGDAGASADGDEDNPSEESIVLSFRREEQMRQWEAELNRLIGSVERNA
ncbi:Dbl homology domain-containing protein [Mycena crocata]|nr:Dbl homology domain-containing protein [Mycena crocata]